MAKSIEERVVTIRDFYARQQNALRVYS